MLHGRCWLSFERIPRPDPLLGFTDFQGPRLIRFHLPRPAFYSSKLLGFYFFYFFFLSKNVTQDFWFNWTRRVQFGTIFFSIFPFFIKKKNGSRSTIGGRTDDVAVTILFIFLPSSDYRVFFSFQADRLCVLVCVLVCVCVCVLGFHAFPFVDQGLIVWRWQSL